MMSDTQKPYLGDIEKTAVLGELFEISREQRDDRWTSKLLANVAEASFACGNPQVINGPDGFPYFQLNIPEPYKEFQCFVVKHLVPDFLVQNGIGIVINAAKGNPDWVFTYGDIVNYYLKNEFYSASNKSLQVEQEVLPHEESVLVAQSFRNVLAHTNAKCDKTISHPCRHPRLQNPSDGQNQIRNRSARTCVQFDSR